MGDVVPFRPLERHFVCTDCGKTVHSYAPTHLDDLCGLCRCLREWKAEGVDTSKIRVVLNLEADDV